MSRAIRGGTWDLIRAEFARAHALLSAALKPGAAPAASSHVISELLAKMTDKEQKQRKRAQRDIERREQQNNLAKKHGAAANAAAAATAPPVAVTLTPVDLKQELVSAPAGGVAVAPSAVSPPVTGVVELSRTPIVVELSSAPPLPAPTAHTEGKGKKGKGKGKGTDLECVGEGIPKGHGRRRVDRL